MEVYAVQHYGPSGSDFFKLHRHPVRPMYTGVRYMGECAGREMLGYQTDSFV